MDTFIEFWLVGFKLLILFIHKRGNFVCHHWGWISIYRPLSYPLRTLQSKYFTCWWYNSFSSQYPSQSPAFPGPPTNLQALLHFYKNDLLFKWVAIKAYEYRGCLAVSLKMSSPFHCFLAEKLLYNSICMSVHQSVSP